MNQVKCFACNSLIPISRKVFDHCNVYFAGCKYVRVQPAVSGGYNPGPIPYCDRCYKSFKSYSDGDDLASTGRAPKVIADLMDENQKLQDQLNLMSIDTRKIIADLTRQNQELRDQLSSRSEAPKIIADLMSENQRLRRRLEEYEPGSNK